MAQIAVLRGLLSEPASWRTWCQIRDYFASMQKSGRLTLALEYAEQHLQHWPDELRWISSFEHPCFPLARCLDLSGNYGQPTFEALAPATHIHTFQARYMCVEDRLDIFSKLPHIKTLIFDGSESGNVALPGIEHLCHCTELMLPHFYKLKSVIELGELTQLVELDLEEANTLESLDGLKGLTKLKVLRLEDCDELYDLEAIRSLHSLELLDLSGSFAVSDISSLATLKALKHLNLKATWVKDLTVLAELPKLAYLDLEECENVIYKPLEAIMNDREAVAAYQGMLRDAKTPSRVQHTCDTQAT